MKYVAGIVGWPAAVVGVALLATAWAQLAHDYQAQVEGQALLGAGLLFGGILAAAASAGLTLLEGIREDLRTAAKGIQ